jgi:class 3 adenylate cyclase
MTDDNSAMKRRLAAILAADIAGYSRLMGEDEAATVRDLKGHQAVILPLVGRYDGRIIDTAGDGILAEFPSVINATECAVEIQTIMATRNEGYRSRAACGFASASTWVTSSTTRPGSTGT